MKLIVLALALVACGGTQHARRPNEGAIAGVVRDHDSGEVVAKAEIHVRLEGVMRDRGATSDGKGGYQIDHLPPGRYSLSASFAGQPINIDHIDVESGKTAVVDLTFTLGKPDPIMVDFGNAKEGAIDRYHPAHHAADTGLIEGTVTDSGTRERVPGAVVTASLGGTPEALQAVSDDQGRYRFDRVPPGTYVVSAYYSIGGRGQIEIRRSDIVVAGGEGVIVPIWVEIAKQ